MKEQEIEKVWVDQLREGSSTAFTQLYLQYVDQLYGYALRLTKSSSDARDIVQETFVRVWEGRAGLQTTTSFRSYLFQISYHLVVDHFRSQIHSVDIADYVSSDSYSLSHEGEAESLLTIEEYRTIIRNALSRCTARQQEIFHLSRDQGLSAKEISKQLKITEKSVNNQLSVVLSQLKKELMLYSFFITIF